MEHYLQRGWEIVDSDSGGEDDASGFLVRNARNKRATLVRRATFDGAPQNLEGGYDYQLRTLREGARTPPARVSEGCHLEELEELRERDAKQQEEIRQLRAQLEREAQARCLMEHELAQLRLRVPLGRSPSGAHLGPGRGLEFSQIGARAAQRALRLSGVTETEAEAAKERAVRSPARSPARSPLRVRTASQLSAHSPQSHSPQAASLTHFTFAAVSPSISQRSLLLT